MTTRTRTREVPPDPVSRVGEAITLARGIVDSLDKGGTVAAALRQCERLADLTSDPFMAAYARYALQPRTTESELQAALRVVVDRRDAEASGIFRYLEDFTTSGPTLGSQLKHGKEISLTLAQRSVPEAEQFVNSVRKKLKYTYSDRSLVESVNDCDVVLERARNRAYRYASQTLHRLLFESVPEYVLDATRRKVDQFLAANCPAALEKFAVAYEELSGTSAENWTNACTAVRRLLVDVADALFPPQAEPLDGRRVGQDEYKNRLWAYAKRKVQSESLKETVLVELDDLGKRVDAIYTQSTKGVHAIVARDEAERIIVRAYLLIADLL